jgi:hypothetical protein
MLILLIKKEDISLREISSIFGNFREERLIDEIYKLEVIKFSETKMVQKSLLRYLKGKRRQIRRPFLIKRVERIIKFLEEQIANTKELKIERPAQSQT